MQNYTNFLLGLEKGGKKGGLYLGGDFFINFVGYFEI